MSSNNLVRKLSCPDLWLLGIGTGLISIHLTLVSRANQEELLSTSILFWAAISYLIWSKRSNINLESSNIATLAGTTLVAILLIRSLVSLGQIDIFLRLMPLLSAIGLGLIASGFRGLIQYWKVLTILCFLIPHGGILSNLYDLSETTAKFSATLLWYVGIDASSDGVVISLPKGFVGVNPGCSGYGSIMQLLGISVIFLFIFSVPLVYKFLTPIVAVAIAFIMNSIRVAIMSVLAVASNRDGFLYWHDQEGSLLFSVISVTLFGLFCFFLIQQDQQAGHEEGDIQ